MQFVTEFEREFGPTHPPILTCSYSQVRGAGHEVSWDGGVVGRAAGVGVGQELQPAHSLSLPLPLVLDQAKQDLRFLLVYLHSPGHQDTVQFCT